MSRIDFERRILHAKVLCVACSPGSVAKLFLATRWPVIEPLVDGAGSSPSFVRVDTGAAVRGFRLHFNMYGLSPAMLDLETWSTNMVGRGTDATVLLVDPSAEPRAELASMQRVARRVHENGAGPLRIAAPWPLCPPPAALSPDALNESLGPFGFELVADSGSAARSIFMAVAQGLVQQLRAADNSRAG